MAMKVYINGDTVEIDQTSQPLLNIPRNKAIYRIENDDVTIFNNEDRTVFRTDKLANIQNQSGTTIGNLQDVVKYLSKSVVVRGTSVTRTTGGTGGTGEANTASNVGGGDGVFKQKVGVDLEFKSLVAGTNITLTGTADEITIDATGGATTEQFYLERTETIDNTTAVDVEYFTFVQGGTEISNNPQLNSIDVFSQTYKREPKDVNETFYESISKRVSLSAGANTVQLQLSNDGSGTARIYEANVQITKV
jgi:hypothetical protein